jgi:hypothetical protein
MSSHPNPVYYANVLTKPHHQNYVAFKPMYRSTKVNDLSNNVILGVVYHNLTGLAIYVPNFLFFFVINSLHLINISTVQFQILHHLSIIT